MLRSGCGGSCDRWSQGYARSAAYWRGSGSQSGSRSREASRSPSATQSRADPRGFVNGVDAKGSLCRQKQEPRRVRSGLIAARSNPFFDLGRAKTAGFRSTRQRGADPLRDVAEVPDGSLFKTLGLGRIWCLDDLATVIHPDLPRDRVDDFRRWGPRFVLRFEWVVANDRTRRAPRKISS